MKMIFVCSPEIIDTKTIINLAMQRSGKKSFSLINFEDMGDIAGEMRSANSMMMTKQITSVYYEELEKRMIDSMKDPSENLIINGFLALEIPVVGYVHTIPDTFFRVYKPDMIIMFEKVFGQGENEDEALIEHQKMNRDFAVNYALLSGSMLKIIKFREKKMMDAVNEFCAVIKR